MLVVNNSKNPVHDVKSLATYSKVGEEAGSCWNHNKNPGMCCLRARLGGRLLMHIGTREFTLMCLRRGASNKPGVAMFCRRRRSVSFTRRKPFTIVYDSVCAMLATKAWAEANELEPCECGVVDGTIVLIVYPVGFLISRSR